MSRWSSENLLISLFPSRVVAAKIDGGWRPRVTGKHIVDAPVAGAGAEDGAAPWQPSIIALDELLADFTVPGIPATVIVSSRFVRYCIVPWRDNVVGVSEQAEFARHCFRSIYGDATADWEIRISSGGYRRNALASAVDAPMLRAVERSLAARGIPITSIQPNFMAACNRFRRELNGYASGCIAVLEPGRIALGIFDKTGWRTLGTRRLGKLKPEALVPVVAQELKSAHADTLPEYLFVAAVSPTSNSFFRTRTKAWMAPAQTRIPDCVP